MWTYKIYLKKKGKMVEEKENVIFFFKKHKIIKSLPKFYQ